MTFSGSQIYEYRCRVVVGLRQNRNNNLAEAGGESRMLICVLMSGDSLARSLRLLQVVADKGPNCQDCH